MSYQAALAREWRVWIGLQLPGMRSGTFWERSGGRHALGELVAMQAARL